MVLSQLTCSWRFARFPSLRRHISHTYARDGLTLSAPPGAGGAEEARGGSESEVATASLRLRVVPPAASATAASSAATSPAGSSGPWTFTTPPPPAPPLDGAAAAALAAAGRQVLPALLGTGGISGTPPVLLHAAGAPAAGAFARGMRTVAVVGALSLEPLSDDDDGSGSGSCSDASSSAASRSPGAAAAAGSSSGDSALWRSVWDPARQLVLVVHDEASSDRHNPVEVAIVRRIMQVGLV